MTKGRLEAFSDGVFAIVITLLILDVHAPGDALTLETLRGLLPQIFTFVMSFVIVGVYWVAHHNMLHFIRAVDRYVLWLNLLLLLAVVFLPFSASLLGGHLGDATAVMLYGVNLILVNAAGTALWLYATSRPALRREDFPLPLRSFVARINVAPILAYALALVLARWQVAPALALYAAVPAAFIIPNPLLDRRLGIASGHQT